MLCFGLVYLNTGRLDWERWKGEYVMFVWMGGVVLSFCCLDNRILCKSNVIIRPLPLPSFVDLATRAHG